MSPGRVVEHKKWQCPLGEGHLVGLPGGYDRGASCASFPMQETRKPHIECGLNVGFPLNMARVSDSRVR